MSRTRVTLRSTLVATLLAVASPQVASPGVFRLGAIWVEPGRSGQTLYWTQPLELFQHQDRGEFFAYEHRLSRHLGLELGAERFEHELLLRERSVRRERDRPGRIEVTPVTLGLFYHPLGEGRPDVHLGPLITYAVMGDLEIGPRDRLDLANQLTFGLAVGIDWPLAETPWGLAAQIRYMSLDIEPQRQARAFSEILGSDPISLRLGLTRRVGTAAHRRFGGGLLRAGLSLVEGSSGSAEIVEWETGGSYGTFIDVQSTYRVEPFRALGPYLGYEIPIGNRLGIELAIEALDLEIPIDRTRVTTESFYDEVVIIQPQRVEKTSIRGRIGALSLTAGLNWHHSPKQGLDLRFGPLAGILFLGDLEAGARETEIDDVLAWGFEVGADIPLGDPRWCVSVAARYLLADATLDDRLALRGRYRLARFIGALEVPAEPTEVSVDHLGVRLGVGYRF